MNKIYFSQVDERWRNNPYPSPSIPTATIGTGGCGVCACSMIVSSFKSIITPDIMAVDFMNNGLRVDGGTSNLAMDWIAEKYGIRHELKWKLAEAKDCLKQGGMVIALCKNGLFTTSGHFIVLAGLKDENTIIVYDSYLYKNKFNLYGRNGKVELNQTEAYVSYENMKEYGGYKQLWCYYPDNLQDTLAPVVKKMQVFNISTHLNIRETPCGAVVGKLNNGDIVDVYEEQDDWARIGDNKWVNSTYLKEIEISKPETKYVLGRYKTNSNLNVRTAAGTSNPIKKTYKKGTIFDTYKIDGSWAQTPSGYVCLDYCSLIYKY